jgi:hypothetical protein
MHENLTRNMGYVILVTWVLLLAGNIFQYIRWSRSTRDLDGQFGEYQQRATDRIEELEQGLQYAGGLLQGIGDHVTSLTDLSESNVSTIQAARIAITGIRREVKVLEDLLYQWRSGGVEWDSGWVNSVDGTVRKDGSVTLSDE